MSIKAIVYELDLQILYKIRDLLSSFDTFYEIQVANGQENALIQVKNESFDLYIVNITDNDFKNRLIKMNREITQKPILVLNCKLNLDEFKMLQVYNYEKNFKIVHFLSHLSQLVEIQRGVKQTTEAKFFPIKCWVIKKLSNLPCHLYLKLSEDKFLKVANGGEAVEKEFVERYIKKGVSEFYVYKDDFDTYSEFFFSTLLPVSIGYKARADYYADSIQVIKEIISEIGINENTMKLTMELVEDAVVEYQDKALEEMLERFKFSESRYIYDHGLLTAIFALAMCEKFEWRNQDNMKKMVFSAIFHDFGYNDPSLAFFEDNHSYNQLRKDQHEEIVGHPSKLSSTLQENNKIPSDVIHLILNHHEGRGDQGYPQGKSALSLSVFECVFIIAHEFTTELYKIAFRHDRINTAIENVVKFCQSGNFKNVRPVFLSIVSDKFKVKVNYDN